MKKASSIQGKAEEGKLGFEVRSDPLIPSESDAEFSKFPPVCDSPPQTIDHPEFVELPASYGSNTIFLVALEPHRLFTYWDIDISCHPGGPTLLRCIEAESHKIESEIEVPFETRNWYLPISQSGATYFVELGYYRKNRWKSIAKSATVKTPPSQLAPADSFDYATLPLHLSFQQLLAYLRGVLHSGEDLMLAVARLQKKGHSFQFTVNDFDHISSDERVLAELLLGKDFLTSHSLDSLNSKQLQEKIQQHLKYRLNSLSASETSNRWENTKSISTIPEEDAQEFFMDVHAEVIFYGTTYPGSTVTIDSKPVQVNPDGSFRFHFIFPDEAYEVPVISHSPDGLEMRAAVLRFHRTASQSSLPIP